MDLRSSKKGVTITVNIFETLGLPSSNKLHKDHLFKQLRGSPIIDYGAIAHFWLGWNGYNTHQLPQKSIFLRSNPLSTQLLRWEELWTLVWRSQYKLEIIWMWHHSEGWDLNQPLLHRDGLPYLGLWHCCCSMGLKSPTCPARLSEKLASSVNMV